MSQENVKIVRRLYDAVARGEPGAVFELYHPEVVVDGSRGPWGATLGSARYRGHDGLRALYREWREVFGTIEESCDEIIDAGDCVVTVVTQRARGRTSGAEAEIRGIAGVWTIRDGRVISVLWHSTREDALEAVGLAE